jgi:hypothetical protein
MRLIRPPLDKRLQLQARHRIHKRRMKHSARQPKPNNSNPNFHHQPFPLGNLVILREAEDLLLPCGPATA